MTKLPPPIRTMYERIVAAVEADDTNVLPKQTRMCYTAVGVDIYGTTEYVYELKTGERITAEDYEQAKDALGRADGLA